MLILTAGRPQKAIWGFFRLIPYLIGMGSVLVFDFLPHWNEFGFGASPDRWHC